MVEGKINLKEIFELMNRVEIPKRSPRGSPENIERIKIFMSGLEAEQRGLIECGWLRDKKLVFVLDYKEGEE